MRDAVLWTFTRAGVSRSFLAAALVADRGCRSSGRQGKPPGVDIIIDKPVTLLALREALSTVK